MPPGPITKAKPSAVALEHHCSRIIGYVGGVPVPCSSPAETSIPVKTDAGTRYVPCCRACLIEHQRGLLWKEDEA